MSVAKKLISVSTLLVSAWMVCSCALITVPVKVAGKVATTTIVTAGKVAGAGVNTVTPYRKEKADEDQ